VHAVVLIDPKFPHNVGNALRACAVFGATRLVWTGAA
jgi:tRNA(Leu) C34 or U34 (ribose-2'-O)-methylase TrmL